mmetsp:Transcript_11902/g.24349  ORF Transcript_11902/g.24349 Transcript_11902/m.24349 type:complete len:93 (+) Transcript_11902:954-1232(+)
MFGMALGFTYKVLFSIFRMGGIVYYVPYCASPGIFSIVNMLFFVIQICCLVAQAPSNTKKKVSPSGNTMMTTQTSVESGGSTNSSGKMASSG